MCEKVSLSLNTNVKKNFSLDGYAYQKLSSLRNWKQCFNVCLKNCQCLSFNFNEVNTTKNCQLNDANTKLEPAALIQAKLDDLVKQMNDNYTALQTKLDLLEARNASLVVENAIYSDQQTAIL